uniref:RRM domain-containing protein n=1 Tax=Meloidogyne incognita TaxID=6306 RepID=A0A914KR34_MELIC
MADGETETQQTRTDQNVEETQTSSTSDPYKCVWNGVPMTWNETSKQWLPDVEVNEDFLAYYNANYGIQYDYDSMPKPEAPKVVLKEETTEDGEPKKEVTKLTKEQKQLKKREAKRRWAEAEAARRQQGWFEMDEEKNTTVYTSGFPPTIDEEEYVKFMTKCGVVQKDPRTGKPKIKLYRIKETGEPKGDGTCCYVKMESVELALQILDGWQWDTAHKIHVERAKFELKGEFDPSKKRQRLSGAQKKKFLEKQEKIFQWKPDKPRNFRNRCECTVVLKGMFSLEEIDQKPEKIFSLKEDTQKLCEQRFGTVKKIVLYESNPEGVITITFDNVEQADLTVAVELALQILDGWQWDTAHKIHVERAKFELKGEFDPSKKRQRLSGAQKKKFLEKQEKIFQWKPDKPRNFRNRCECTVVLKGMFSLEEIDQKPEKIFSLKEDTQKLCEQRFGTVKKIVLYESNPEGVITITFDNVEQADLTVAALNGRIVAGRTVKAFNWDGKEKFKRQETEEERKRRENAWTEFLEESDDSEDDNDGEGKNIEKEKNNGEKNNSDDNLDK